MTVPTAITDLSTTAASNSPSGSENVFPNLDDYVRAGYAFIAALRDKSGGVLSSVSGTDTITATLTGYSAWTAGSWFEFVPAGANTGTSVTLNINGLGAKNIKRNGSSLAVGALSAIPTLAYYDGTSVHIFGVVLNGEIVTANLADASVTTAKIVDANVTQAKVTDGVQRFTRSTAQTASGQTSFTFDDVPSWCKRIIIDFSSFVKNTGSDNMIVQLKVSGSAVTTGYVTVSVSVDSGSTPTGSTAITSGFPPSYHYVDSNVRHGRMVIENVSGNTWVNTSQMSVTNTTPSIGFGSGSVTLSGIPTGFVIKALGGTGTFTSGTVNAIYEG